MDFFINPLVPKIRSYARDSTHIISTLHGITDLPFNAILCTLDVSSSYTNILHYEGIKDIQETLAIHRTPTEVAYNSYIEKLLKIVLENNYFYFDDRHCHQIPVTAMDTKLAPSYC